MKRKHIDAGRELRLWITQVILPTATIILAIPQARDTVVYGYEKLKKSFNKKRGF